MNTFYFSDRDLETIKNVLANQKKMMQYMAENCKEIETREMLSKSNWDDLRNVSRAFGITTNK